jgi:hypothetical protein
MNLIEQKINFVLQIAIPRIQPFPPFIIERMNEEASDVLLDWELADEEKLSCTHLFLL